MNLPNNAPTLALAIASAAAAALTMLPGCAVGPDYKRPDVSVPTAFSATQPASTQPDKPVPPVDLTRWWESFNDPQLNQLVNDAVANNFDVQIAQARVRQARAQLDFAFGGLFPTVDATGAYSRSKASRNSFAGVASGTAAGTGSTTGSGVATGTGSTTGNGTGTGTSSGSGTGTTSGGSTSGGTTTGGTSGFGGSAGSAFSFSTSDTDLFQGGFDAGWEIDVFGGQRRAVEAAAYTLQAQIESRRNTLVSLLSEVARNYILLRGYQFQLSIVDRNIAAQADTLNLQRQKLAAGIATDLTVAQAEALLASTRAERPTLQTDIDQTIHRLSILLGREPMALADQLYTESPIPVGPPSIPPGLPSTLVRRRPDVRNAERNLAAATASIGVAIADLFPKFSLTGNIGLSSQKFTNWGDSNSLFWSVGPNISWRILDAGQILSNIKVERAAADAALLTYRQTVYQALSDVEDAITAYNHEQAREVALSASVDANRRAVDLARQLNEAGVVDFLNVLTAEQSLFQSEDQLAQSQQTVSTNLVAVYKALGGGWETTEAPPEPDATQPPYPLVPATQPIAMAPVVSQ